MNTSYDTWMCIVIYIFCAIPLTGCVYTYPVDPQPPKSPPQISLPDSLSSPVAVEPAVSDTFMNAIGAHPSADSQNVSRKDLLDIQAEKWMGTPHRWGGESRSGIDCSALVQRIYSDAFEMSIPRTTKEQVKVGRKIRVSDLEIGDLVFYRINMRKRHVGIFVGNNTFLHASSSDGVAISSLDTPYWKSRFWMARRILVPEGQPEGVEIERKKVQVTW